MPLLMEDDETCRRIASREHLPHGEDARICVCRKVSVRFELILETTSRHAESSGIGRQDELFRKQE
jgi:hypothetical protein